MKWNEVKLPHCDAAVPAKIRKAHASLTARLEKLNKQRAEISDRTAAAKSGSISPESIAEMNQIKTARLMAWQSELELSSDVEPWIGDYMAALQAVKADAFKGISEAEQSIRAKLESIGYVSCDKHASTPGKITPDMVNRHPDYLAAKSRKSDVDSMLGQAGATIRENEESRRLTGLELNRLRNELTAVA